GGWPPEKLLTDEVQNPRDIIARFCIRWNAPEAIDGRFACVVRSQRQLQREAIEQRLQVPDPAFDVLARIVRVGDVEAPRRLRHELHQAHRALPRARTLEISRLD